MAKIAIDLHGVLDAQPEAFREIIEGLEESKEYLAKLPSKEIPSQTHEDIYIVSGPPAEQIVEELNALGFKQGVHYHKVISVVDFLKETGETMWTDEKGTWWASEQAWWGSKGRICGENEIDLLVDDHIEYQPSCQQNETAFALFSPKKLKFVKIFLENGECLDLT